MIRFQIHICARILDEDRARVATVLRDLAEEEKFEDCSITSCVSNTVCWYRKRMKKGPGFGARVVGSLIIVDFAGCESSSEILDAIRDEVFHLLSGSFGERCTIATPERHIEVVSDLPISEESREFSRRWFDSLQSEHPGGG